MEISEEEIGDWWIVKQVMWRGISRLTDIQIGFFLGTQIVVRH